MHFADRLSERIDRIGSRLVIGIDPDPKRIFAKDSRFKKAFPNYDTEQILDKFCHVALEAAKSTACAIKPQAAFFESLGLPGLWALQKCLRQARTLGIPVILDAKRGDIGNTAMAYADAYLDPKSGFFADALTVNPYLGPDTLEPFAKKAQEHGGGLFVLVKTSNPGSGAFQNATLQTGAPLYAEVAKTVRALGQNNIGASGYSNIGAVCGATYPKELAALRDAMPQSIFLIPGYGAQGGTAADTVNAFHPGGKGAVVSASRSIIFAYERLEGSEAKPDDIFARVQSAAENARNDIETALRTRPST
jgi:orotidine-5'-phosphate decarboxylase